MSFKPENIITNFEKDNICLGIDEAGRGPVIGPMIYACCYFRDDLREDVKEYFKFNDSKKLTPEKREKMFEQIKQYPNIFQYDFISLSPQYLSEKMLLRNKINLNKISHDSAILLINNALSKNVNLTNIFVDTVGQPDNYRNYIIDNIKKKANITVKVEKKADENYSCVSAASIVAKVTRDKAIENIEYSDKNLGSGYPSDCYTVNWMERNYDEIFGYPDFIRFSWGTVKNMFKKKKNKDEWENYIEQNDENEYKRKKNKKDNNNEKDNNEKDNNKNEKDNNNVDIKEVNKRNEEEFNKKNFYYRYKIDTNVDL